MKKTKAIQYRFPIALVTTALLAALAAAPQSADSTRQPHLVATPEALKWAATGPGQAFAVVSGSPNLEGAPFVVRVRLDNGVRIPPHWHPADEHLTVISGVFHMGMGEKADHTLTHKMAAGSYALMPKEVRHFARAEGETVIQIHGIGPFKTYWVDPPGKASAESGAAVPFPVDYRTWAVTKSAVVGPESRNYATNGGFHHYYANDKAMEGFRTSKFPDGSVIVDERLQTEEREGRTLEGARRSVSVMMKDSRRYQETGGWGFDAFPGDSQTVGAPTQIRAACFECHSKQKDRDFVFSQNRK